MVLVVVRAFAFLHDPVWRLGPVSTFLVSGAVGAALFILSRDLLAQIV